MAAETPSATSAASASSSATVAAASSSVVKRPEPARAETRRRGLVSSLRAHTNPGRVQRTNIYAGGAPRVWGEHHRQPPSHVQSVWNTSWNATAIERRYTVETRRALSRPGRARTVDEPFGNGFGLLLQRRLDLGSPVSFSSF